MKKEKYLQIFNYLLEFSKLRSNPVRDIESSDTQYPDKVWFADIPQYEIFDCITFPNYNQDADYWLKIAKPKGEPTPPTFAKLSETLTDWIVKESLTDENGIPTLKDFIIKNDKTIYLSDNPEVEKEFQTYLNEKWIDDFEFYNKEKEIHKAKLAEYEKQSKTYKHLFSIYNKAQQFGEEFELIVGVGLLHFQEDANTPLICRHIITCKTEITFNEKTFAITVTPTIESELKVETDSILDLEEIFDSHNIIEAEKLSQKIITENEETNPFSEVAKQSLLAFSKRFHLEGDYRDDLTKSREISKKPIAYFAPALILRKRNTKSFIALYEKIIENISTANDSIDIPSINDIIGYLQSPEDFPTDSENESLGSLDDETIYFPKKYNDEQIEIIEKARRNNKVLVQGPPGTGKSHTIANLICHLLANGKKVLVTAYTKRALEVLKNQLPKDFQNLTVNLLSGDSSSIQDLDASVNAINDELSRITNLDGYKKEIEEKKIELSLLKEQKANTKNEWLKVKEKTTRRQNINRIYQGTLSEIAERIEKELSAFAWFKDEFTDISKIDLLTETENFNSQTRYYQSIDCSVFNFTIPQKEKLLSLSELREYRKVANELVQKYSSKDEHISINCKDYSELKKQLQALHKSFSEIENNVFPMKAKLISDYRNNLFLWKDKLLRTANTLAELPDEKLKQFDRSVEIKYPNDKSLIQIKSDAEFLLQLLSEGKKLRGLFSVFNNPLAPANVKQRKYFIQGVQVNGSDCDTEQEFITVLADIKTKQDFEELKTIWEIEPNENSKSYSDRAKFYRQLKEDTEGLISLLSEANKIKSQIELISSVRIQDYESAKVHDMIEETDYNFLLAHAKAFKAKIVEASNHLSIQNIHPIATTIIKTVADIDTEKYEQHLLEIDNLISEQEKYDNYKKLHDNLHGQLPTLVKEILENTFEFSNFRQLENAIHFKHAFAEIEKL
ncbi:MAG TPA: AAA domain-containing protein, partial [Hanamia sp.]